MRNQTTTKQKTQHFTNLAVLFGHTPDFICDIYKHLQRIETDGHRIAERYASGEIDSDQVEVLEGKFKHNLLQTLQYARSEAVKNLQFNWDPRGYFLKLNDSYVRENRVQIETDWGGYGIICPDFKRGG